MNKIILTDVDGVLLNWFAGFDQWMVSLGFVINRQANMYSLEDRYDGELSVGEIRHLIAQFNHTKMFGKLPPERDAVEYVRRLAEEGYRFVAITSMGGDESAQQLRKDNLIQVFGDIFEELHCIPLNTSKHSILERWKNSKMFWVEDKLENAICGAELGLTSILLTHPYNENHSHSCLLTVNSWEEIYNLIKETADAC